MSFANPLFFWALLSLSLPILIHLFRFRRFRTVYFTNVRFLKALQKETHSRSRLRHLLILLMRCLAITALVFAFARPYIAEKKTAAPGARAISIYLDNSFSMDARGESSTLLELAKKQALDIVSSGKPSDRYQLITNDFEGRHQRLLSAEQFSESLEEVKLSPAVKKISEVVSRQSDLLKQSAIPNKLIYLISDFQSTASDFTSLKSDTAFSLHCVHLDAALADNISIDSAWFERPYREKSKPENIAIAASNHSKKRFDNIPAKLIVDNVQRGLESFTLGQDSSSVRNLVFSAGGPGFHSARIEITDFPIVFDDGYYISWNTPEQIKVLSINGGAENVYLNQLFQRNQAFSYLNVSEQQIDFGALSKQQCIILNEPASISSGLSQELKKFVESGGTLLIFPSLKTDLSGINGFLGTLGAGAYAPAVNQVQKVALLNSRHPIYDDVFEKQPENIDLPQIKIYLPVRAGRGREELLMKLENQDRFLTQFDAGSGKVYLCAVPLNESAGNFQQHALFIPTIYKMALYSLPPVQLSYTIGDQTAIPLGAMSLSGDQTLRLKALDDKLEIIPEHRIIDGKIWIYPGSRINKAGNYSVLFGDKEIARLSFNYSREESLSSRLSAAELEKKLQEVGWDQAKVFDGSMKEIGKAISDSEQGKPLWKVFIILALLFLAGEIFIIRLIK